MPDKKRLQALMDAVKAVPINFNYKYVCMHKNDPLVTGERGLAWETYAHPNIKELASSPECNSCGCLVGYHFSLNENEYYWKNGYDIGDTRYMFATDKLKLTRNEAEFLFMPRSDEHNKHDFYKYKTFDENELYLLTYVSKHMGTNTDYQSMGSRKEQLAEAFDRIQFIIDNGADSE